MTEDAAADLWVVVPSYETAETTAECVRRLLGVLPDDQRIVVVDDCSRDDTLARVASVSTRISVLRQERRSGFSATANRGIDHAFSHGAERVLLLNSDCFLQRETVRQLLQDVSSRAADGQRPALWSLTLTYADGRPQWSGADRFPSWLWMAVNASGIRRLGRQESAGRASAGPKEPTNPKSPWIPRAWAPATCWLIEGDVWLRCGPFATQYQHYGQDLEVCWRASRVGVPVLQSSVAVVHLHGQSTDAPASDDRRHDVLWSDLLLWTRRCRGPLWTAATWSALLTGAICGCVIDLSGRVLATMRADDSDRWKVRYDQRVLGLRRLFSKNRVSPPPANTPFRL